MELLFATKNENKLKEIRAALAETGIEVRSLSDCGITMEVEETGETFEQNAEKKAREYCAASGIPAIAEDSGLEIDYLGGAPGVYSSRYMGEDTPYSQKNAAILMLMMAASDEKRTARYVSVFAAAFPDGRLILARDTIEGVIGREAKGTGGFGYDPIFFVPELGKSLAEISLDEKNKISHRGKSLRKLRELLRAEIEGLE